MKTKTVMLILLFAGVATIGFGQKDNKLVRQGNKDFEKENYTEAETTYLKALAENPNSTKAQYNLGETKYRQDNQEAAIKNWATTALNASNSTEIRSQSFFNIGNSLMKSEKYKESIEAYKQALRLNPADEEARYNLEYARRKLQAQQQQQQQQGGGKDDQQKNEDQKNQDQQQSQDQQQNQDQQSQQQNKQDQQQKGQQAQQQEISKEEAEHILEAMKNNEKKTLDKVKQQQTGKPQKTDKDW